MAGLARPVAAALAATAAVVIFLAARQVVPSYLAAQNEAIVASAQRHGLPPEVLAAVLYNEMVGQEYRFLDAITPGDGAPANAVRDALLGWHFLTLKQAQWGGKALLALAGVNTTVGPTGIRVSVGREIRREVAVEGGRYRASGWAERPSMVLDLMSTSTAIEYLAANLERGIRRAGYDAETDWLVCARWHNTGLVADRTDVPRPVWDKGTRYVARVRQFLPQMTSVIGSGYTLAAHNNASPDDAPRTPLIGLGVRRVQTAALLAGMLGTGVP